MFSSNHMTVGCLYSALCCCICALFHDSYHIMDHKNIFASLSCSAGPVWSQFYYCISSKRPCRRIGALPVQLVLSRCLQWHTHQPELQPQDLRYSGGGGLKFSDCSGFSLNGQSLEKYFIISEWCLKSVITWMLTPRWQMTKLWPPTWWQAFLGTAQAATGTW